MPIWKFTRVTILVVGIAACDNAGLTLGFDHDRTGTVSVLVYLDRDGTKTATAFDTTYAGASTSILPQTGETPLRTVKTDAQGVAKFERLPLGEYRVRVEPVSLGDSIQVAAIDSAVTRLTVTDTLRGVLVRLAFPELSIRQTRGAAAGRRVFIRGVLLSALQNFRDTTVHLADTSGFLRLTRAGLLGSAAGNNPGDSVTVIGTVSSRGGQPTADLARIARLAVRPPPVPIPLSSGSAATADLGRLDAALVQITSATISDTATIAPDFKLTVSDGTGSLDVTLDATLNVPKSAFRPGRSLSIRGVLVPNGAGAWTVKPRDQSDIVLN